MASVAIRSIIRPASRLLIPAFRLSGSPLPTATPPELRLIRRNPPLPWIPSSTASHSLRPPVGKVLGPCAWVKCETGQPILPNQRNEESVKRRNEKKRINQHRAFIMSEKRKHKVQMRDAKRNKIMKRVERKIKKIMKGVERKMAPVTREEAWQVRSAKVKHLEAEKCCRETLAYFRPKWGTRNFCQPARVDDVEEEEIEIDQRRLPADYDPANFDPTEHRSPPFERVWSLVAEISGLTLAESAELSCIMMRKLGMKEMPVVGVMKPRAAGVVGTTMNAGVATKVKEKKP